MWHLKELFRKQAFNANIYLNYIRYFYYFWGGRGAIVLTDPVTDRQTDRQTSQL